MIRHGGAGINVTLAVVTASLKACGAFYGCPRREATSSAEVGNPKHPSSPATTFRVVQPIQCRPEGGACGSAADPEHNLLFPVFQRRQVRPASSAPVLKLLLLCLLQLQSSSVRACAVVITINLPQGARRFTSSRGYGHQ